MTEKTGNVVPFKMMRPKQAEKVGFVIPEGMEDKVLIVDSNIFLRALYVISLAAEESPDVFSEAKLFCEEIGL